MFPEVPGNVQISTLKIIRVLINLQEATVWKDNIVVATEYIGPIEPI
ncbi:MAG: hypothetical protein ACQER7_14010 [Bacteroidota bacterium]